MDALSRRALLVLIGGAATSAAAQAREATPSLTRGPFYPPVRPLDDDADLTLVKGQRGRAKGVVIDVAGRVVSAAGAPVAGAVLDLWQANAFGRYRHPGDASDAPLDPAFQGAALLRADAQGRYRFRTIRPARYGGRTPHIHVEVRGRRQRLVTQMFFPGEPLNARAGLYRSLGEAAGRATARAAAAASGAPPLFLWDIVLA